MLGGIFFIDVGDFTFLPGEREKQCPGGRLPLNAGELQLPVTKHRNKGYFDQKEHCSYPSVTQFVQKAYIIANKVKTFQLLDV